MQSEGKRRIRLCLLSLYSYENLGLRSLFSMLKNNNYEVYIIFFKQLIYNNMNSPTSREKELLIDILKGIKPSIIGISLRSSFYRIAQMLIREIRREMDIPILIGGIHATIMPEECIQLADMVCVGEGELALLDLAGKMSQGEDLSEIKNLWIRNGDDVVKGELFPLITDLDNLPFPDYGNSAKYAIEGDRLSVGDPILNETRYELMTSRGCPFFCSYCTNNVLRKVYPDRRSFIRRRSVGNVIGELGLAKRYFGNLRSIFFMDEVFVAEPEWVEQFCIEYKSKIGLPFACDVYPTTVTRGLLNSLKDAGLYLVEMGIQSGSERIRKEIFERNVSQKILIEACKLISETRVIARYDVILDNPFEKESDKRANLEMLLSIPRPFEVNLFSLVYFPKTKLTQDALEKNYITEADVEGNSQKVLSQWRMTLYYKRTKEDAFYNALVVLASKGIVPKALIRSFMKSTFLKRHPFLLIPLVEVSNLYKLMQTAIDMLIKRELNLHQVKKAMQNIRAIYR